MDIVHYVQGFLQHVICVIGSLDTWYMDGVVIIILCVIQRHRKSYWPLWFIFIRFYAPECG